MSALSRTFRECKSPGASGRFLLLPAFNEEERLGEILDRIRAIDCGLEVIVVDDGSRDRTAQIARRPGIRLLRHPFNLGYGAALQTGYKYAYRAGASLLVQMDADGQHDPAELGTLITPIEQGHADLIIGSRFLDKDLHYHMGVVRSVGRRLLQGVAKTVGGLRLTDPTSGFQAMNRKVLSLYVSDVFPTDFPDLDILIVARRVGIRIEERPVTMAPSPRASYLHSGLAPLYYLYKMTLSLWAGISGSRRTLNALLPFKEDE